MICFDSVLRKINPDICSISGSTFDDCVCYDINGNTIEKPSYQAYNNMRIICDLSCCKIDQKQVMQSAWQSEVDSGFTYDNNTFDFDDVTLGIIGARLAYNESLDSPTTADLTFYNADKVAVVFADKSAFKAFCIAFILERNTIDQKRVSLKAQIDACATKEEVEAIIW